MSTTKQNAYEKVIASVIEEMESGVVPWHRPWVSKAPVSIHGHRYRGMNAFLLGMSGFSSHVWMTFQQAKERGGHVKKGEKGTPVLLFKTKKREEDEDEGKAPFFATTFTVFNFEQTEGVELPEKFADPNDGERDETAEDIVRGYLEAGPELEHGWDRAAYSFKDDRVVMPSYASFQSPAHYYSALFHEIVHSTGHPKRLSREGIRDFDAFGSHQYAKEELIAEIGAALLCGLAGVENRNTVENTAAYLRGWKKQLQDDPGVLVSAASAAQKAVDLVCGAAAQEKAVA